MDLAFNSAAGFLPYLFAGYFGDGVEGRWYFANARRHEEMRQAIMRDNGITPSYQYGQIWLNERGIKIGRLSFSRLVMKTPLENLEKAEVDLRRVVRSRYLDPDFYIHQPGRRHFS